MMKRWIGIFLVVVAVIVAAVCYQNREFDRQVQAQQTSIGFGTGNMIFNSSGISGPGSGLTSLNASNISSGTLADARISGNVPLINAGTNTFTGNGVWSTGSTEVIVRGVDVKGYSGGSTEWALSNSTGSATFNILAVQNAISNQPGLQVATASGCTITAGAIGDNCTSTVSLPVAEPDTSYATVCTLSNPSVTQLVTLGASGSLSTTSFVIPSIALSTSATGGGTIFCIVTHN